MLGTSIAFKLIKIVSNALVPHTHLDQALSQANGEDPPAGTVTFRRKLARICAILINTGFTRHAMAASLRSSGCVPIWFPICAAKVYKIAPSLKCLGRLSTNLRSLQCRIATQEI